MPQRNNSRGSRQDKKLVGKYKQVRVSFIGASFLFPDAESSVNNVDDAFGVFILDEIFRRQSILSKVKGVLKKTHYCRRCDSDIMGLKAHGRRFSIDISYRNLPVFKLEIDMPAIPCRTCGTPNAVNEQSTEEIISGAIAQAFLNLKQKT